MQSKRTLFEQHFLFMLGLFILGMELSSPHEAAEKRTFSKLISFMENNCKGQMRENLNTT